jgi:hypothetical protein
MYVELFEQTIAEFAMNATLQGIYKLFIHFKEINTRIFSRV